MSKYLLQSKLELDYQSCVICILKIPECKNQCILVQCDIILIISRFHGQNSINCLINRHLYPFLQFSSVTFVSFQNPGFTEFISSFRNNKDIAISASKNTNVSSNVPWKCIPTSVSEVYKKHN